MKTCLQEIDIVGLSLEEAQTKIEKWGMWSYIHVKDGKSMTRGGGADVNFARVRLTIKNNIVTRANIG